MSDKLKPCPFCGGEVEGRVTAFGVAGIVNCGNCHTGFIIPWDEAESGNELLNAWNSRANKKEKKDD